MFMKYIYLVLKQVHPNVGIASGAHRTLNSMIISLLERITNLASKIENSITISSKTIQTVVKLIFPAQLCKNAILEGSKAEMKYKLAKENEEKTTIKIQENRKAGLQFSVARVRKYFKDHQTNKHHRITASTGVYLSAVLEYICAEVLELAVNASLDAKRRRITIRHIFLAVKGDEELLILFQNFIFGAGVMPCIHATFLSEKSEEKKEETDDSDSDEESDEKKQNKHVYDIDLIKKKEIRYLCRRAGIPHINSITYEEISGVIKMFIEKLCHHVVSFTIHNNHKTVSEEDVVNAIKILGYNTIDTVDDISFTRVFTKKRKKNKDSALSNFMDKDSDENVDAIEEKWKALTDEEKKLYDKRPFFNFTNSIRDDVKNQNPDAKITDISRIIGEKWKALTEEEKNNMQHKNQKQNRK